jgi:hypothetical protein
MPGGERGGSAAHLLAFNTLRGTASTSGGRTTLTAASNKENVVRAAAGTTNSRFEETVRRTSEGTVLSVYSADQATVRALMIMLWDSGHEVLAMTHRPG